MQRTHEIGVRMALGASPPEVTGMMVRQGVRVVVPGIMAGLVAALALSRLMSRLLYEVQATDAQTLSLVTLVLAAATVLSCYVPARKAARVAPATALRHE
jgi:putative ABC transport system permease protein